MNEKIDGFKCRTCGFVAFGENSSTAKYKECLGCGNLMGDEPAVKQTASSNEVSLLESCNNCKHQFSTRASVCPKCNHERTSECFVCKKQIAKSSTCCPECGDPAPFEQATNTGGDFNQKVRDQPLVSESTDESKKFLGGSYHPWRRLFAKTVDISTIGLLAVLLISFGLGIFFPNKAAAFAKALENQIVAGIILLALWIPLEAILLSSVGNTPAKWLFGISVKTATGGNLSFHQAIHRAFLVSLQGMALGIPFVAFFTQIFAYRRLTKTGTTLWDTATNSVVTHKTWGVGRAIVCVISVFFVLVLISVFNVASK